MRCLLLARCNCYGEPDVVDHRAKNLRAFWTQERRAIFCLVGLVLLDDPNEIMFCIGFVVFDGIQDMRESLEEPVDVRVGRLFLDYDKGFLRLHELCRYLRRRRHGRGCNERPRFSLLKTIATIEEHLVVVTLMAVSL